MCAFVRLLTYKCSCLGFKRALKSFFCSFRSCESLHLLSLLTDVCAFVHAVCTYGFFFPPKFCFSYLFSSTVCKPLKVICRLCHDVTIQKQTPISHFVFFQLSAVGRGFCFPSISRIIHFEMVCVYHIAPSAHLTTLVEHAVKFRLHV